MLNINLKCNLNKVPIICSVLNIKISLVAVSDTITHALVISVIQLHCVYYIQSYISLYLTPLM